MKDPEGEAIVVSPALAEETHAAGGLRADSDPVVRLVVRPFVRSGARVVGDKRTAAGLAHVVGGLSRVVLSEGQLSRGVDKSITDAIDRHISGSDEGSAGILVPS